LRGLMSAPGVEPPIPHTPPPRGDEASRRITAFSSCRGIRHLSRVRHRAPFPIANATFKCILTSILALGYLLITAIANPPPLSCRARDRFLPCLLRIPRPSRSAGASCSPRPGLPPPSAWCASPPTPRRTPARRAIPPPGPP